MINEQGDKNKIGEALTKVRQSLSNGIISPKFQDWMQPIQTKMSYSTKTSCKLVVEAANYGYLYFAVGNTMKAT